MVISHAGRKLSMLFVDLKKTFNRVPRKVICLTLKKKDVMEKEAFAITDMHKKI